MLNFPDWKRSAPPAAPPAVSAAAAAATASAAGAPQLAPASSPAGRLLALRRHTPELQLAYFEFAGRLLGKALYEGILVEPRFAQFFLRKLLGKVREGRGCAVRMSVVL